MIIDLPTHRTSHHCKAEQQGLSVNELLTNFAKDDIDINDDIWLELDKHGLNPNGANLRLNKRQAMQIIELLENPPPPNPIMRELLGLGERMIKGDKINV
ncbi:hypothetical protein LU293_04885 [Moraxella nasovis]|uniref:hypothetical protein n=1 Tax=Moraxella nasovis TaxID=2904121 RepID=UPI001F605551|nr:hypothetical protein [Moraxella nasovis]UNU74232.1 hypothetical protein LU293_04885 [Moraxella nasovis]